MQRRSCKLTFSRNPTKSTINAMIITASLTGATLICYVYAVAPYTSYIVKLCAATFLTVDRTGHVLQQSITRLLIALDIELGKT